MNPSYAPAENEPQTHNGTAMPPLPRGSYANNLYPSYEMLIPQGATSSLVGPLGVHDLHGMGGGGEASLANAAATMRMYQQHLLNQQSLFSNHSNSFFGAFPPNFDVGGADGNNCDYINSSRSIMTNDMMMPLAQAGRNHVAMLPGQGQQPGQEMMMNLTGVKHKRVESNAVTTHPYYNILLNRSGSSLFSEDSAERAGIGLSSGPQSPLNRSLPSSSSTAASEFSALVNGSGSNGTMDSFAPPPAKKVKNYDEGEKPRRPLTAYNFFFSEERERILALLPEPICSKQEIVAKSDPSDPPKKKDLDQEHQKLKDIIGNAQPLTGEEQDALDVKIEASTKRILDIYREGDRIKKTHRKVHGKVAFQPLARMIGERWRGLAAEKKERYVAFAKKDAERYNDGMKRFSFLVNQREKYYF